MARMSPVPEAGQIDDPDAIIDENDISHSRSPKRRSSRKVVPHSDENSNTETFVEIKPKRILRVVHLYRNRVITDGESDSPERRNWIKNQDDIWVHHGKNGLTIQTSAQINHSAANHTDLHRMDTTVTQIDLSNESPARLSSKSSRSVGSGVENKGFENSEKVTSSQTSQESDAVDTRFSSSSPSQENGNECRSKSASVLERSATTRSVDIELQENSSTAGEQTEGDINIPTPSSSESNTPKPNQNTQDVVLFFIHGVGGSIDVWKQQLDYFSAEGYEIVCPDLIGHGFSAAPHNPKDYCFEEISIDLLLIFDMFSKKQNIVIGHSYGCSFAAVIAKQRQSKVNKMILVSGGSPIPLAPQPGIFSLPTCALACIRPIISRGFKKSAFHSKSHISQDKAFDVPSYVLKYTMNGQWWPDGGAEYHQWIKAATLLIHGAQDKLVLIEEEEEMLETIFGSRMIIVDNASHMVMMEKPDEVNHIIHDFLLQSAPIDTSIKRTSTRTRDALKKKPWLRRALSKSKACSIEPMEKHVDDTLNSSANGRPKTGTKAELDRKGSSLSLKSVKSLPHDLVAGNLY